MIKPRVTGKEGISFALQAISLEFGKPLFVNTKQSLAFVKKWRIEKRLPDPIVSELGEAGVALIKIIEPESRAKLGQAVRGSFGKSKEVVRCSIDTKKRGIEIFKLVFIA